jgi:4-amino-4-deoxy-L-arabinose transferase-like glycosyltransferase
MRASERQAAGGAETGLAAALVVALTLMGAALRVAIVQQDLFADELSSYWIVSANDLAGVVSTVNSDAEITPPLSFVSGWLATRVELSPEFLRAPSLVGGILTIPGVYLLGLRTVGRAAGLVGAALVALAPFMLYYSAEARGYALMMAFVTLSTLAMLAAVDSGRARWWALYAVASCAAVYTHYTCVFVLGAQLAWVLWARPETRRPALLANLGAAAGFAPWVPGLINDLRSPTTQILSALQPFDAENARLSLQHWAIGYPYAGATGLRDVPGITALLLLGAAVVLVFAGLVRLRSRGGLRLGTWPLDRRTALIFGLAVSTPVGAALFSAVGTTTVFSTRNLAASWPALALAVGTLVALTGPRLRFAAAALTVGCFAIGAAKLLEERYERPHYGAVADFIHRTARPGDVVIDESAVLSPGPLSHLDTVIDSRRSIIRSRAPQQRDHPFNVFDSYVSPEDATRRAIAAASGARIFLVTDVAGARIARPLTSYRLVESVAYPGLLDLVVNVYEERASSRG